MIIESYSIGPVTRHVLKEVKVVFNSMDIELLNKALQVALSCRVGEPINNLTMSEATRIADMLHEITQLNGETKL